MPTRGSTQINTFVKGLLTEASPLAFPPNTALDILNFRLNKDGSIHRRLGLDVEEGGAFYNFNVSAEVLATARKSFYRWQNPNGNPNRDIGVVQLGSFFWFINLFAPAPSIALLNGGNPIDAGVDHRTRFSMATINGYLAVVSAALDTPFLVTYNEATDSITYETADIMVRDIWGVDDFMTEYHRPSDLNDEHRYNLRNQGWSPNIITTCGPGIDAVSCTFLTHNIFPSNSDHWSIGRIEDLTSADVYKYDPNIAARNIVEQGQTAKGSMIINLYNRGSSRMALTGINLPLDRDRGRVSTIASYAGRIFYSGIYSDQIGTDARSPKLSNIVLFSQLFINKVDLVKCYQQADPTSIDFSDIVDTDGGLIQIPECGQVTRLMTVKDSLFVFATNGIWRIRGDEGGFRATSFQVDKISNVFCSSPDSIIELNGTIFLWGIDGIYSLVPNDTGMYNTISLTIPTIQTLYNSLPDISKLQAKGFYDLSQNRLRWLYYSDESKTSGNPIDTPALSPSPVSITEGATSTLGSTLYFDIIGYSEDRFISTLLLSSALSTVNSRIIDTSGIDITSAITANISSEPSVVKTDTGSDMAAINFTDGRVLVIYGTNEGLQRIGAVCATLSGTTYTPGTTVYPYTSSGASGISFRTVKLTENLVLCVFYDAARPVGTSLRAFVLSLSGTTITAGAILTITATSAANNNITKLTDSSALLVWEDGVLGRRSAVLSVSGTTVSESAGSNIANMTGESMRSPVVHLINTSSGYLQYVSTDKLRVRKFTLVSDTVTVESYLEITTKSISGTSSNIDSYLVGNYLISTFVEITTNIPYINVCKLFPTTTNISTEPLIEDAISATAVVNESESLRLVPYGTNKYAVGFRSSGNTLNLKTYSITV